MKKIASLFTALFMIFSLCVASVTPAFAANVCTAQKGNLTQTVKFKFSTGGKIFASDKVVLKQTKGTSKQHWWGKTKNAKIYGEFTINVLDKTDNKWVYIDKKWKDGQFTISGAKLKKNHTYEVTIEGYNPKYPGLTYNSFPYVFDKWTTYPSWSVSKTGGNVNFCK